MKQHIKSVILKGTKWSRRISVLGLFVFIACTDYVQQIDDRYGEWDSSLPSETEESSSSAKSDNSVTSSSSSIAQSSSNAKDSSSDSDEKSSSSSVSGPVEVTKGTITDSRDGQTYKTVTIGSQTWMAENLNYKTGSSFCYNNEKTNCTKYGRLYKWEAAFSACPDGWHLPSKDEWETLFNVVGGLSKAGKVLKSSSGWINSINGTDDFGFSALPAGYGNDEGNFDAKDYGVYLWSSTENSSNYASYYVGFYFSSDDAYLYEESKDIGLSVRCLQGEASGQTEESSSSESPISSSSSVKSSSSAEPEVTYLAETPFAADLEVSGDTLFAIFQRYEPNPKGGLNVFHAPGLLAMYKLSDGTLLDTITLATKNPMTVKVVNGNVYVGTLGEPNSSWEYKADDNRGIEKVDLKQKKSELWVSGTKLGAGVYTMDVDEITDKAYVAVYKAYQDVPAVEVYLASKTVKTINGIIDATGSILFDSKSNLAYIGDRGSIDFNTGNMTTMVAYTYDGTNLTALYNDEIYYQPAGIAVIDSEVFVYFSDYNTAGKLYWIDGGNISDENISFSTDTKIVTVNNKIIVLDRKNQGSIALVDPSSKTVSWKKSISAENPQDIVAIDNSTAWVAMYNTAEIRKISLVDGSEISSIDTKDFCAKSTD